MLLLYYLWGFGAGAAGAPPPDQWYPTYPDRPIRPAPRHRWQTHSVGPLDPIVNPPPPVPLVWEPHFPNQLLQIPRRPITTGAMVALVAAAPSMSHWWPTLATPRRVPPPLPQAGSFPWSTQPSIASTLEWRPRYPDLLRRRPVLPAGQSGWLVSPTTVTATAVCVELTDETLTQPLLTSEAVVSPSVTVETFVQPLLTSEDLC